MAKDSRDYVWLKCTTCDVRKYRTQKRVKGVQIRLTLRKYCNEAPCRGHFDHVETKK
ncbi:MAG: 50S ribosomal protein L33 [Planctomycetota bacterium]